MKRKHRDNTRSYYHSMLSAAIVHPDQKEVFILDNEPIVKQDGNAKNDCEQNAAKRMFSNFNSLYSNELMVFAMDALYACNPIVETISANENWKYVINIKEKGNNYLFEQFDNENEKGNVEWHKKKDSEGEHLFGYINNLELNKSNPETKVNMLYYIHTDKNGKETVYSWITNIELTKKNVYKVMKIGRSRWKIENDPDSYRGQHSKKSRI